MVILNDLGMAVWRHKKLPNLFVHRTYDWVDRVIIIDESDSRRVVAEKRFTEFNFTNWIPVTVEEFKKVKRTFMEIYAE